MKYVTKTGRVIAPGRVTRASHLIRVKQRGQERPLPQDLMCHPKALSPTPRHPNCFTFQTWRGEGMRMAHEWSREQMERGKGLSRKPKRFELTVRDFTAGFTDDMNFAMAWKYAAELMSLPVGVIDNGD